MFQMKSVAYPEGYCQSPCAASKVDQSTGLSADCPGDTPTCSLTSQTAGLCVAGCSSYQDCREGNGDYVCANVTGTASSGCIPRTASGCDPDGDPVPQGLKCPAGYRCTSFSPDNSYGQCAFACDPLVQNCPDMGDICIVERNDPNAGGVCIGSTNLPGIEGDQCLYLNGCGAGYQCVSAICRKYCRAGGQACPPNRRCSKIPNSRFDETKLGVCVP